MFKVAIHPCWEILGSTGTRFDTTALLSLLRAVELEGSIAQAARRSNVSYRYAWGLLRDVEAQLGRPLIQTGRGRGTLLTPLAQKLLWADRRVQARLSPLLETLASELEGELAELTHDQPTAIRLDASHGFAVAALLQQLALIPLPIELRYRNCTDAVAGWARGECHLAGFHIPEGKFEAITVAQYLPQLRQKDVCLLHLAKRRQGLFVAAGNPKNIHTLADLTRADVRFVNRQSGSGTRMLLERMLADADVPSAAITGFQTAEFTHSAVAAFIASNMADVGFGVQTGAERFGLTFQPMVQERYFFALDRATMTLPLLQQLIAVIQSPSYRAIVASLPGYDATDTGQILSLDQAFG
jgi:molybdate transport repressor ModE-like protein